jgi:hypothetical protein
MGFKLTTLVVIGTDCTGSCKSNPSKYDHYKKNIVINYKMQKTTFSIGFFYNNNNNNNIIKKVELNLQNVHRKKCGKNATYLDPLSEKSFNVNFITK